MLGDSSFLNNFIKKNHFEVLRFEKLLGRRLFIALYDRLCHLARYKYVYVVVDNVKAMIYLIVNLERQLISKYFNTEIVECYWSMRQLFL